MKNEELLNWIDKVRHEKRYVNILYGVRMGEYGIEGLIDNSGKDHFWLVKHQLCQFHEEMIDKWIYMGGTIE